MDALRRVAAAGGVRSVLTRLRELSVVRKPAIIQAGGGARR
jgi:hypothetical protein